MCGCVCERERERERETERGEADKGGYERLMRSKKKGELRGWRDTERGTQEG